MLNPSARIELRTYPWRHLVIDDLLSADFLSSALQSMPVREFENVSGDPFGVSFQALGSMDLARVFMGPEFRHLVSSVTGTTWRFDRTSWIQLRRMGPDSVPLPRHTDRLPGRQAVALFYLNPDWSTDAGGELCLHSSKTGPDELRLSPVMNRLVFFESTDETWHSVRPVLRGERLNIGWEMTGDSK